MLKSILTAVCLSVVSAGVYAGPTEIAGVREAVRAERFETLNDEEKAKALLSGGVPRDVLYRDGKLEVTKIAEYTRTLGKIHPYLIRASAFDLSKMSERSGQAILELFERTTAAGNEAVNAAAQLMQNANRKSLTRPAQRAYMIAVIELLQNKGVVVNIPDLMSKFDDIASADDKTLKETIIPIFRKADKLIEENAPLTAEQEKIVKARMAERKINRNQAIQLVRFEEAFIEIKMKEGMTREEAEKAAKDADGCYGGVG
jgi:hypothetical protein